MRDPANNPIERLDRLLFEVAELLHYSEQLFALAAAKWPTSELPARPPMTEYEKERVRQKLTYSRARAHRLTVAHIRARGGGAKRLAVQDQTLTAEEIAKMLEE